MEGEEYAPELKSKYFEEWAQQLSYAVEWCNEKAKEFKKKEKRVVRTPKKK